MVKEHEKHPLQPTMRFGAPQPEKSPLADHNKTNTDQEMELIQAVKNDNLNKVNFLLRSGVNVNAVNKDGMSPLMFSIVNANINCMLTLLQHKANPKLEDTLKVTALMLTCKEQVPFEVLQEFIKHTHPDNGMINAQNIRGATALIWATAFGDVEKVKLLLKLGADKSIKDDDGRTAADWAVHAGKAEVYKLLTGRDLLQKRTI